LFVVNVDWFFISHRLPVAIAARKSGFDVHLATTVTSNQNAQLITDHGITLHPINFDRSVGNLFTLPISFFSLFRIVYSLRPDILHLVTILPVLIGGLVSRFFPQSRVVYAISGLGTVFLGATFLSRLRRYFVKLLYILALRSRPRAVIFQNSFDCSSLSSLCSLSPSDVFMIPGSGVDLDKYAYHELPATTPTVLMASRLLASKGVREFVEAASILYERNLHVNFQLAGVPDISNPSSISHSEYARWSSLPYISLLGYRSDLHTLLASSHIACLPSYYPEGLPKFLCEAAACGRAVVTTEEPGCRDAVDQDVTGIFVPSRDPHALANAIENLLLHPDLIFSMGQAGRKRAERLFDINVVTDQHLSIYSNLLENS